MLFRFSDYFTVKYEKNNTVCHDKSAKYGSFTVPVKNTIECAIICLYYYPNTTYIEYHNNNTPKKCDCDSTQARYCNTTTSVANGWTVYSVSSVSFHTNSCTVLIKLNFFYCSLSVGPPKATLLFSNTTCASTNDGERQNLESFKDCAIYCDSLFTNRIVSSKFIEWKARIGDEPSSCACDAEKDAHVCKTFNSESWTQKWNLFRVRPYCMWS